MIVPLREALVGDRFVGNDGGSWTVLANHEGQVTMARDPVREHGYTQVPARTHVGTPAPEVMVDVLNRDDSLTHAGAISNLVIGGVTGRIIGAS